MIQQLSVFLENRYGRLAEMARVLADAEHNMRALMVADTAEFGVARILVDRPNAAKASLEGSGYGVSVTEVVAVRLPDTPGSLADALEVLRENGLNVEYAYVFVRPEGDFAVDIFRFDEPSRAQRVLTDAGYSLVMAEEIYRPD